MQLNITNHEAINSTVLICLLAWFQHMVGGCDNYELQAVVEVSSFKKISFSLNLYVIIYTNVTSIQFLLLGRI